MVKIAKRKEDALDKLLQSFYANDKSAAVRERLEDFNDSERTVLLNRAAETGLSYLLKLCREAEIGLSCITEESVREGIEYLAEEGGPDFVKHIREMIDATEKKPALGNAFVQSTHKRLIMDRKIRDSMTFGKLGYAVAESVIIECYHQLRDEWRFKQALQLKEETDVGPDFDYASSQRVYGDLVRGLRGPKAVLKKKQGTDVSPYHRAGYIIDFFKLTGIRPEVNERHVQSLYNDLFNGRNYRLLLELQPILGAYKEEENLLTVALSSGNIALMRDIVKSNPGMLQSHPELAVFATEPA